MIILNDNNISDLSVYNCLLHINNLPKVGLDPEWPIVAIYIVPILIHGPHRCDIQWNPSIKATQDGGHSKEVACHEW